jgi:hypothetical protein
MKLIAMMDELLRNRSALYQQVLDGDSLKPLYTRLFLIFLLSSAIYGAVMGGFRCLHPEFNLSNFELTAAAPDFKSLHGEIAGMMTEHNAVYTRAKIPADLQDAMIRFNTSDPSESYAVSGVTEEKGFTKITLGQGVPLTEEGRWALPLMVAVKIPLLFILTLGVCAFALYILNLAFGMQLRFLPSMTLVLFALAGTGVMLMVFAPISALFTVVTTSYHFMKIFHVIVFAIAGLFGVRILGEGLAAMQRHHTETSGEAAPGNAKWVLLSWLLLYCLVGAQLAWTLKPFLGTPYLPATPPFRVEQGNIFVSVLESTRGIKARD